MGKGYSVNLKEKLFTQTRKIKRKGGKEFLAGFAPSLRLCVSQPLRVLDPQE